MYKQKRIKYKGANYYLNVFNYKNQRIGLRLENKNNYYDISINLSNCYLEDGSIFLNPDIRSNTTLYKLLRKCGVIKDIKAVIMYDYTPIPITKINLNTLKDYDNEGVMNYILSKNDGVNNE